MRYLTIVALAAVSLAVTGCYVQSLHPLYTEDELTFDAGLVGTWADPKEPDESVAAGVMPAAGRSAGGTPELL